MMPTFIFFFLTLRTDRLPTSAEVTNSYLMLFGITETQVYSSFMLIAWGFRKSLHYQKQNLLQQIDFTTSENFELFL